MGETSIVWKLRLASSPERVYEMLATDAGRAAFWAESSVERDGRIRFVFPDGTEIDCRILQRDRPTLFSVEYHGGSRASFELQAGLGGGTDLTLTDRGVRSEWFQETAAGWVSVLMALKGAVDHGIDLRNHDRTRTWEHGYVDN